MRRRPRLIYSVDPIGVYAAVAEALTAATGTIGDRDLSLTVGESLGRNNGDRDVTVMVIGIEWQSRNTLFSRRLGLENEVFKSWEAADTISVTVIIAAGSAATGEVDSRCTLTRAFICSGVVSYMNRLDAAVTKPQRQALTFHSGLAIFSRLALRRRVFLIGIQEIHNFHTVMVFQCMRSGGLTASSAGHASGKAERNRKVLRNRRKLVRSGMTKGFARGHWNG
jgi:hypothetical protein